MAVGVRVAGLVRAGGRLNPRAQPAEPARGSVRREGVQTALPRVLPPTPARIAAATGSRRHRQSPPPAVAATGTPATTANRQRHRPPATPLATDHRLRPCLYSSTSSIELVHLPWPNGMGTAGMEKVGCGKTRHGARVGLGVTD